MSGSPPTLATVLMTLIGVTWRRLFRGRALWVCALIAALPMVLAVAVKGRHNVMGVIDLSAFLVMTILPPVFVASSIGEEIEDRTTTYLWSRPLPRWTVIVAKLLALAPVAMVLVAGGWFLAFQIGKDTSPPLQSTIAMAAGAFAIATMSAGIATLVPRHGMALAIVYIVIVDMAIGIIPASLQNISITRQVRLLAGLEQPSAIAQPAITMAIIAGLWLTIGLLRIRKLES